MSETEKFKEVNGLIFPISKDGTVWKYVCFPNKNNPFWCGPNECDKCKANTIAEIEAKGCGHFRRYIPLRMGMKVRENRLASNPGNVEQQMTIQEARVISDEQLQEDLQMLNLINEKKIKDKR